MYLSRKGKNINFGGGGGYGTDICTPGAGPTGWGRRWDRCRLHEDLGRCQDGEHWLQLGKVTERSLGFLAHFSNFQGVTKP